MTRAPAVAGPVVVALAGAIMCAWSWGKWPDPVIDFGREVYTPWQLSEGRVLYRDIIAYFNGPLSPYAHAMLFELFGASLRTLVIFNLCVIAAIVAMIYWLVLRISGHLAATACGVAFLVLFAFAQFVPTGNYNYVTPYSYELPHGIALTLAGIVCLAQWIRAARWGWLAASGAMLGLVALTKAEIFLAAAVALGAGMLALLIARRAPARQWLNSIAIFTAAAIVPPLVALLLLSLALEPLDAIQGMLGAWRWIGRSEVTDLPYFRQLAGTDDIGASILRILIWTGGYALLLAPALLVEFLVKARGFAAGIVAGAIFVLIVAIGATSFGRVNWTNFIQPAPLVLLVTAIVLIVLVIRHRDPRLVLPLVMIVWSGAMLAKIPLNARIVHYGFALAMPAAMMLIIVLIDWLPRLIERRGTGAWPLRATVAAALLVAMWAYLHPMRLLYEMKTIRVGRGTDQFWTDSRGVALNALLDELDRAAKPGDTITLLPEGLLANYLMRRVEPTGYLQFTPPAIAMYGEDAMLESFQNDPPDWIALTSIDTAEYGPRFFGKDYALKLNAWIESNYEPAQTFRASWFDRLFEIRLMRRSPSPREGRGQG